MKETGKVDFSTSNSYCGNGNTSTTTRICDSDWSVNFISAKEVGETIEFLYWKQATLVILYCLQDRQNNGFLR